MQSTLDDAIGGFNSFIASQKALPGQAQMTLTLFNTEVETRYAAKDIQEVPELNHRTYVPEGYTALLDAVGVTLTETQQRIKATPDGKRPAKVMVVVITDGMENSSREYRRPDLAAKIKALQDDGWQFLYLGADLAAFGDAGSIGLSKRHFLAHGNNQHVAYMRVQAAVSHFRAGDSPESDEDEDEEEVDSRGS